LQATYFCITTIFAIFPIKTDVGIMLINNSGKLSNNPWKFKDLSYGKKNSL